MNWIVSLGIAISLMAALINLIQLFKQTRERFHCELHWGNGGKNNSSSTASQQISGKKHSKCVVKLSWKVSQKKKKKKKSVDFKIDGPTTHE